MKNMERAVSKYLIKSVHILSHVFPVKERIVFASYRMDRLKDSYKFIHDEIQSRRVEYSFKFLLRRRQTGIVGKLKYFLDVIQSTHFLATSKYFLIDDFYLPVYLVTLRKETEVIQVWHACGAFKKFGYSLLDKKYGVDSDYLDNTPIHKNYSHVLVSSKEVVKFYAEAFNMDESNIRPLGIPRTDLFFDEHLKKKSIEKTHRDYPILKNKKVILYAPTFRGSSQANARSDIGFDLAKVENSLGVNCLLVMRMHPFVTDIPNLSPYKKVINLTHYGEINDILLIADILITDYSSVVFEYSLLDRPIIFYANDRDDYQEERDFYYDYEQFVPGPIVESTEQLITAINEGEFDRKRIANFRNKFFDLQDGNASQRFVDQVILKNE